MLEQSRRGSPLITVRRLRVDDAVRLAHLFETIEADASAHLFHPHPFTAAYATGIARYAGKDMYLGVFEGDELAGYAMLRGWDAGFSEPSLGIYLLPFARGRGLGRTVMASLHQHAGQAGARRIRLKVYPDNKIAMRLYEDLGYRFTADEAGQRVGYVDLPDNEEITL